MSLLNSLLLSSRERGRDEDLEAGELGDAAGTGVGGLGGAREGPLQLQPKSEVTWGDGLGARTCCHLREYFQQNGWRNQVEAKLKS